MNKEKTKAAAAVMLAFADGKPIEWRNSSREWHPLQCVDSPIWNWQSHEYRVKPQVVKSRRYLWINPQGKPVVSTLQDDSVFERFQDFVDHTNKYDRKFVRWIDPDWVETEL